jgi:hypothetical protein
MLQRFAEGSMSDAAPVGIRAVLHGCTYYYYAESADEFSVWTGGQRTEVADLQHFGMRVEVGIWPDNDRGYGDLFDATVCSPSWLAAELSAGNWDKPGHCNPWPPGTPAKMLHLSGVWVMESWSQDDFEAALRVLCDYYSPAPDWETLADRLTRHLNWDFDYRYDDEVNERHGLPPITRSVPKRSADQ